MSEPKQQKNFGWLGIALIAAGILLLFHNFGWLTWSWHRLWRAWPVVLVIWGLDLLVLEERVKRVLIIAIIVVTSIWVMGGWGRDSLRADRMMPFPSYYRLYWR